MSIREVTAEMVTTPLHTEFVTALRRTKHAETVLVSVTDEAGRVGRGEAPQTWRITGQSLAGAAACVSGPLRDAVLGADPDDLNTVLNRVDDAVVANSAAKAAVDVALHDLAAQRLGVSLTRYLGGTTTDIATVITLPAGEIPDLVKAAQDRISEGFRALKVKVGTDPAGDLARLEAIRDAVGPRIPIRLDANQGWTPKQAVRIINGMEDAGLNIELVEQPTPGHDLVGLAHVTAATATPILADESVHGLRDLTAIIHERAADAVNIKLAKCGGLRTARTMIELARQHGLDTSVGSMMEGRIGVAAIASLSAACGTTTMDDLDAAWWLAGSDDALRYSDGYLRLSDGPGLTSVTFSPRSGHTRRGDGDTTAALCLFFLRPLNNHYGCRPRGGLTNER
jgi:L-alanine-DL-glutamate epimerase-like enolase superfamily enzyme